MAVYYIYLLVSFVVSLCCGLVLIPTITAYCRRKGLYDVPNARKVHKSRVPRLGGVCFAPCMLVAVLLAIATFNGGEEAHKITFNLWTVYFLVGLLIIYGVGLVDDLVGLDAKIKFVMQMVSASLLPMSDLYVNNLYGLMGIDEIPYWVGYVLTVFLIVFIDNAVNLIDGIDGLSSGLAAIALCGFLVCFMREGLWTYGILITGMLGVVLAFMRYNIFGRPGKDKIFMGDSGSLTLGFILGVLLVKLTMDNPRVLAFHRDSMVLAFSLLLVPILDVSRVILVRLYHRAPLFDADKNHLHHKVMRMGLNQHQALVFILLLALLFIGVNVALLHFCGTTAIVASDVVLWVAVQQVINHFVRRNHQSVYLRMEPTEVSRTSPLHP